MGTGTAWSSPASRASCCSLASAIRS
uniref:Uncharacterized protein n=1 Tax=Macrostomum lignano TaxID=282301 RepID=A0A1I8HVF9_9PLAT